MNISVAILTYNRPEILAMNLNQLSSVSDHVLEIIVVDNSSDDVTANLVAREFPGVRYFKNQINQGAAGRNRGLEEARGDIVVTLDDDVIGIGANDLQLIENEFKEDRGLGGLCFQVRHYQTGLVCNWCHHRKIEEDAESRFLTYEISEGAVAYRRVAVHQAGYYFLPYFISYEGRDLAYRIMNCGYTLVYQGKIKVVHYHAESGRADWRRYYFDTRNAIWMAIRNLPFGYGLRFAALNTLAMGVYSIRDGFCQYWLKAIRDAIAGGNAIARNRLSWTPFTEDICKNIDKKRPSFFYKVRMRLFLKKVEI